jgi:hypothetical protein
MKSRKHADHAANALSCQAQHTISQFFEKTPNASPSRASPSAIPGPSQLPSGPIMLAILGTDVISISGTDEESSVPMDSRFPLLNELRTAVAALPLLVAEGNPSDLLARFSIDPVLEFKGDDTWEGIDHESSKRSPCSNVPLRCPLCPKADPAIWKYNLRSHLIRAHNCNDTALYKPLYVISKEESILMKASYLVKVRHSQKKKKPVFWISEAHSTRLMLR